MPFNTLGSVPKWNSNYITIIFPQNTISHKLRKQEQIIIILPYTVRMSNSDELVYMECIHKGCTCKRQFLKRRGAEMPQYVCLRHRRLYFGFS